MMGLGDNFVFVSLAGRSAPFKILGEKLANVFRVDYTNDVQIVLSALCHSFTAGGVIDNLCRQSYVAWKNNWYVC